MKSSVTGKEIPKGTGKMYVQKDGKILYFASRKEEKNVLKLGRSPRKMKWAMPEKKRQQEKPITKAPAKEVKASSAKTKGATQ